MNRKLNQVSLEPYGFKESQPAQRQSHLSRNLLTCLALAVVIVAVGCLYWAFPPSTRDAASSPANNDPMYVARRNAIVPVQSVSHASTYHDVVYKVATNRTDYGSWHCFNFDATYAMPSGTAQRPAAICDGDQSAIVDHRTANLGDSVYLSVQNDEYYAVISCEIWIDGALAFQTYSEGQYKIASCSGSVDETNAKDNFQPTPVPTPRPSFVAQTSSVATAYRKPTTDSSLIFINDTSIRVVGRSADNKWIQLDNGYWIERTEIFSELPALPITN